MMRRALSLSLISALTAGAAFAAGAALAQGQPVPSHDPVPGQGAPAAPPPGHGEVAPGLGFAPMMLEIGDGELLSFPRSYGQKACPETVIRRIFRNEVEDAFVASLRCWAVPSERSGEFVQALDQAIVAAGWEFQSGAGMGAHYEKGEKDLDVLIFGFDQFGDEPGQTDVGYLFGVVEPAADE